MGLTWSSVPQSCCSSILVARLQAIAARPCTTILPCQNIGMHISKCQCKLPTSVPTFNCILRRSPVSHLRLCHASKAALAGTASTPAGPNATVLGLPKIQLQFRNGSAEDAPTITRLVWAERMNPLGLDPQRFLVAECIGRTNSTDGGGSSSSSSKGAGSSSSPANTTQNDLNQNSSSSSSSGGSGNSTRLCGFGQLQAHGPGELELRSLVVDKECRGQGVGTALVRELLARAGPQDQVFLTTVSTSIPFYQRLSFEEVVGEQIPRFLWFEVAAGRWVARSVGKQLVVMRWKRPA